MSMGMIPWARQGRGHEEMVEKGRFGEWGWSGGWSVM